MDVTQGEASDRSQRGDEVEEQANPLRDLRLAALAEDMTPQQRRARFRVILGGRADLGESLPESDGGGIGGGTLGVGQQMPVGVDSGADGLVAEASLNDGQRDAGG